MEFYFNGIQFTDLEYKATSFEHKITAELQSSLGYSIKLNEERKKKFDISFNIALQNDEFSLKLTAIAHFIAKDDMTPEDIDSPLVQMNAPAIAFPYVRAFISNFTLNCGYNPVFLPTFNFVKLSEEKLEKSK